MSIRRRRIVLWLHVALASIGVALFIMGITLNPESRVSEIGRLGGLAVIILAAVSAIAKSQVKP